MISHDYHRYQIMKYHTKISDNDVNLQQNLIIMSTKVKFNLVILLLSFFN